LTRTGDKNLLEVSDYVHTGKLLTTYVPVLFQGTEIPINASFNPILETFRTSCRGPNLQNLPRKGDVRGCFVSRGNTVFVTCDYDTLEMRTLAQTYLDLIGPSPLAEALKQGLDPHLSLAADLLGITEEEAARRYEAGDKEVENARQFGKIGNFGFPGGLSALTFVDYARTSYGKEVSPELAQRLHKTFRTRWKMEPYFRHCSGLTGPDVAERLEFPRSGLVRGRVPYTAVCNSYFQHLAAMGAKDALYHVSKECYLGGSPLAGSRPVVFLHDEILMEVPYGDPVKASAAADRLQQVMIERMSHWVPDIPIKATPGMMKRWTKGVKPVRQDGVLVPSKPVKKGDDKIVWEADL
jgi:DNA polymerase I-like protein with 3'-5' exonuclease and polymerase domains